MNVPFRSSVSSSLNREGMWTTTPDPMKAMQFGLIRPEGLISVVEGMSNALDRKAGETPFVQQTHHSAAC